MCFSIGVNVSEPVILLCSSYVKGKNNEFPSRCALAAAAGSHQLGSQVHSSLAVATLLKNVEPDQWKVPVEALLGETENRRPPEETGRQP
ncbi:unnamed protein product [Pleuronectes platessa]|uniref:Uncharacterized protein n=1 Tax=Pleuronectes platessa TaxID=8262 RepID=A0A9N7Y4I3_PLEPL|nr:unnamed protein product [Pleuronectes platessa]